MGEGLIETPERSLKAEGWADFEAGGQKVMRLKFRQALWGHCAPLHHSIQRPMPKTPSQPPGFCAPMAAVGVGLPQSALAGLCV